ncbi:MAG: hypothetical protein ACK45I_01660, partial [Bacteroidota bacterium]
MNSYLRSITLVTVLLTGCILSSRAQTFTYQSLSQSFTQGVASSATQCSDFEAWRATLTRSDYAILKIRSNLTTFEAVCSTASVVQSIANALRTSPAVPTSVQTFTDGPNTWTIGACNGIEVSMNAGNCACFTGTGNGTFRSCIVNLNWGGVNGVTCNAPSQTLTI